MSEDSDAPRPGKVRIAGPLMERCRNAASYLAGPPNYLTLSGLVAQAVDNYVSELEEQHGPIPIRPTNLPTGRRVQ